MNKETLKSWAEALTRVFFVFLHARATDCVSSSY
jgi:hypothetical protein